MRKYFEKSDARNADRKARRLSSAATVAVSDDEGDDFSETAFEKLQALLNLRDKPTKP